MKLLIKKQPDWKDLSDIEIHDNFLPRKANDADAGYDIIATSDPEIVAEKEDILAAELLEDKPTFYRRVSYIQYQTNLYWTPGKFTSKKISFDTMERKEVTDLDWHIELFPRSSLSKYNLALANPIPTIDTGYQGHVLVRFKYIWQPQDLRSFRTNNGDYELVGSVNTKYIYQKGDKIVQLKPRANVKVDFILVDELPVVDTRKEGGFGSSGK